MKTKLAVLVITLFFGYTLTGYAQRVKPIKKGTAQRVMPKTSKDLNVNRGEATLSYSLKGTWTRVEGNNHNANGMTVVITNSEGIIVNPARTRLKKGDVKWKSIEIQDSNSLKHQELGSNYRYYDATMTFINQDTMKLNVVASGAGNYQTWVRLSPGPNEVLAETESMEPKNMETEIYINNDRDLFQASLVHTNGKVYFFRRAFYHAYDFENKELLELNRIGKPSWKGTDISLDAAMTNHKKNEAYLFKGNVFYRYSFGQQKVVQKGIVGIDDFQGLEGPFDAAYWVNGGEVAFFFKGGEFIQWSATNKRVIQRGAIGEEFFQGVPKSPDAAILRNGYVYFFKGDLYYRYDGTQRKVNKRGRLGYDEWPNVFPSVDAVFDAGNTSRLDVKNQLLDVVKGEHVFLSADYWPEKRDEGNWFTNLPIFVKSAPGLAPDSQALKRFRLGYDKYPGVPPNIDAVYHDDNINETLFFKSNKYYKFDNTQNSVVKIGTIDQDDFKGIPYNVDAAFFQGSFIWFFKGNKYYQYMPKTGKVFREGYIRDYFIGVPDNLDGAALFHGKIHFYKKTLAYVFDQNTKKVIDVKGID